MSVLKRDDNTIVIEEDNGVGNSLQFTPHDDGTLYVEIDNPWSGDTQSGFGRTAYFTISKADAGAAAEFLAKWAKQ